MNRIEVPDSSRIIWISYDGEEQMMQVCFRDGSVYELSGVPQALFTAFANSDSKGKFYEQNFGGRQAKFPYKKIQ